MNIFKNKIIKKNNIKIYNSKYNNFTLSTKTKVILFYKFTSEIYELYIFSKIITKFLLITKSTP